MKTSVAESFVFLHFPPSKTHGLSLAYVPVLWINGVSQTTCPYVAVSLPGLCAVDKWGKSNDVSVCSRITTRPVYDCCVAAKNVFWVLFFIG